MIRRRDGEKQLYFSSLRNVSKGMDGPWGTYLEASIQGVFLPQGPTLADCAWH